MRILLAFLLLASMASAQEPKRHWWKDRQWWLSEAEMGAVIAAATFTSANRCRGCTENNPVLGTNPSNGALAGTAVGVFSINTGLHIFSWHLGKDDPSKAWREMSYWFQPACVTAVGIYGIRENLNVGHSTVRLKIQRDWLYDVRRPQ